MTDQSPLNTFYQRVKLSNPRTAALMHADILQVAIFARAQDKTPAIEATENLRKTAQNNELPESLLLVLEDALTELGYP